MRRGATLVVIGLVAAIALAAGIDALRGESSSPPPGDTEAGPPAAPSTTSTEGEPEAPGPELDVGGTLYYTDASCKLRAAELPGLGPETAPNWDECGFVLSPDAKRVAGAGAGWDPHSDPRRGRLFQSEDGLIQVSTNAGPEGEPFRGSAPAWRPDGTLTYFARGAVRELPTDRVVISHSELVHAALTHPNAPADLRFFRRIRVTRLAWLDQKHAVLAVHAAVPGGADLDFAATSRNRRLHGVVGTLAPITALWTSPEGRFWSIAADTFQLHARDGDSLPLPQLTDPHAVTWSPDETQMAVATRASVVVFAPGETAPVKRVPVVAADLDWRGEAGPAASAGAGEAVAWLERAGATGRLFVSQAEGSGCVLKALRLPDLAWAEEPRGAPGPCRFRLDDSGSPLPEDVVPQPGGDGTMSCRGIEGCSAAWLPGGRPAYVAGGELYAGRPGEGRNELLLSSADLRRLLGRPSALEEVAWVDDEHFWAILRSGSTANVALMTLDSLVSLPSFTTRMIEGLRRGATEMVAANTDLGVVFFDTGRRRALTFPAGQAVAWAPGEPLAAVATPNEILFVDAQSGESVSIFLPVRDLEWTVP